MNTRVCPGRRQSRAGSLTSDPSSIRSIVMAQEYEIKGMTDKINSLRKDATELKKICGGIPTVDCNVNRILANDKMLEININDAAEILGE